MNKMETKLFIKALNAGGVNTMRSLMIHANCSNPSFYQGTLIDIYIGYRCRCRCIYKYRWI